MTEIKTTGVCTFLMLLAPKILIPTIKANITITATSRLIEIPKIPCKTHKYALKPINAKADLSIKLAHNPNPDIVPIIGPNVFSI